jgi:hypothetical protein
LTFHPSTNLVSVFKTDDPGLLPLATMALDAEHIDYFVRHQGKADSMQWVISQTPTTRPVVLEILVASDLAQRARELLVDLENQSASAIPIPDAAMTEALPASEPPNVRLEDAAAGTTIGTITESQLQEITSRLEEDGPQQYFITGETVDMLQQAGVEPSLVNLLRNAVGTGTSGLVIRWAIK